jgi:hypothetical protein
MLSSRLQWTLFYLVGWVHIATPGTTGEIAGWWFILCEHVSRHHEIDKANGHIHLTPISPVGA